MLLAWGGGGGGGGDLESGGVKKSRLGEVCWDGLLADWGRGRGRSRGWLELWLRPELLLGLELSLGLWLELGLRRGLLDWLELRPGLRSRLRGWLELRLNLYLLGWTRTTNPLTSGCLRAGYLLLGELEGVLRGAELRSTFVMDVGTLQVTVKLVVAKVHVVGVRCLVHPCAVLVVAGLKFSQLVHEAVVAHHRAIRVPELELRGAIAANVLVDEGAGLKVDSVWRRVLYSFDLGSEAPLIHGLASTASL